jgi:SulP family sulfate permease
MTAGTRQYLNADRVLQQLLPGLTVSFVAISLGAAFGVLSGRGALAGILSAGIIALITAAFGGTRIQCSGPTAPMTAVTVLLVTAVGSGLLLDHPDTDPDRFINLVLLLTGLTLIVVSLFRLGRFIRLIPKLVISGFMNGIAVLIWVGEIGSLFGLGGKAPYLGNILTNLSITCLTVGLIFMLPVLLRQISARLNWEHENQTHCEASDGQVGQDIAQVRGFAPKAKQGPDLPYPD